MDDDAAQEAFRAARRRPDVRRRSSRPSPTSGSSSTSTSTRTTCTRAGPSRRRSTGSPSSATPTSSDGALWLATEKFGDDKDRVIVRSNGQPAYLSGDLAYYLNKRERGFDRCLILLGADHHGYVGRMMAMCAAFGDKPGENLEIIIGQMVNLLSHGTVVRMGKRSGNIVTLLDLVDEIGVDAARYALVRFSMDVNLDIDVDLWARATSDNPVFYVQYAHARISSILRNAADLGLAGDPAAAQPPHARAGGRAAAGAGGLPAGRRVGGAAARAAPDRALPRGHRVGVPQVLRLLPRAADGRRGARRPPPRPAAAGRRHARGARQRPRAARGHRARADVGGPADRAVPRSRLGARRRGPQEPRLAPRAHRHQPAGPEPVVADRPQGRRRPGRRRGAPARPGGRAHDAGVRPRRGRLPLAGPCLSRAPSPTCGWDVFYAGKAFLCTAVARLDRRGGAQPRRVLTRGAHRRARRRLRPGADRLSRQQQVLPRAAAGRRHRGRPDHRRLLHRDRPAGRDHPRHRARQRA